MSTIHDNPFEDADLDEIDNDDFLNTSSGPANTSEPHDISSPMFEHSTFKSNNSTLQSSNTANSASLLQTFYFNYEPVSIANLFHTTLVDPSTYENKSQKSLFYPHWICFTLAFTTLVSKYLLYDSTKTIYSFMLLYAVLFGYAVFYGSFYCFRKNRTTTTTTTTTSGVEVENKNWLDHQVVISEIQRCAFSYTSIFVLLALNFIIKGLTTNVLSLAPTLSKGISIVQWVLCIADYCVRSRFLWKSSVAQYEHQQEHHSEHTALSLQETLAVQAITLLITRFMFL